MLAWMLRGATRVARLGNSIAQTVCLASALSGAVFAGFPVTTAQAERIDTNSRAFQTLVAAICAGGWTDLLRLKDLGMIDDVYVKEGIPEAEKACNAVYSAKGLNGIGAFLILKHNAFSNDDISWASHLSISNGQFLNTGRLVTRVPRVFALADYYARAEIPSAEWEPAGLPEVTKKWIASGANVNMRTCHGFRLADLLVLAFAPNTMEILKAAGADFNYRTPYILKDGFLAYSVVNQSAGNQYSVNFKKYGVYFYGSDHPSFDTSFRNACVEDKDVEGRGLLFVEYLIHQMNEGRFLKKTRLDILKTVITGIELPADIVHSVLHFEKFPRNGLDVLDVLLANGADINARNESGLTLIERVFNAGGDTDLLKELTRRGAEL